MQTHHVVVCALVVFGALIVGLQVGRSRADEDWRNGLLRIQSDACIKQVRDALKLE